MSSARITIAVDRLFSVYDLSVSAPQAPARVAVVVVNYQSYPELHGCIGAIARANASLPVIVVDHASDRAAAHGLTAQFPFVRLVAEPANHGFAAGVNRGARHIDSDYMLLVNPDCVIDERLIDTLAGWMDAHPDVAVVGPRIRNADGSVQASARKFPDFTTGIAGRSSWLTRALPSNPLSRRNLRTSAATEPADVDWVSGACMMIRRGAYEALGGMDEGFFLYWEDADFCRRLRDAGWRTVYHPGVAATHSGGRSSRHAADASLVAFHRSAFRLFWKHASPAKRVFAPIVFLALRARLALMRCIVRRRARQAAA